MSEIPTRDVVVSPRQTFGLKGCPNGTAESDGARWDDSATRLCRWRLLLTTFICSWRLTRLEMESCRDCPAIQELLEGKILKPHPEIEQTSRGVVCGRMVPTSGRLVRCPGMWFVGTLRILNMRRAYTIYTGQVVRGTLAVFFIRYNHHRRIEVI